MEVYSICLSNLASILRESEMILQEREEERGEIRASKEQNHFYSLLYQQAVSCNENSNNSPQLDRIRNNNRE